MKEGPPNNIKRETAGSAEEIPAEFEFHQQRFEKMAKEFNERGLLQKVMDWRRGIGWKAQMTAMDFAHEEALRDNADFERRRTEEFQAWERNLRSVLDHLIQRRDGKEERPRKFVLLILGGGMKGPYSAGQALGLHEVGLGRAFDVVVGISAGAGTAAYFSAGKEQAQIGTSLFYEECTTKDFIDFRRLHQIMNVDFIAKAMRHGPKTLDQKAIMDSPQELYVGVTDPKTFKSKFIDVKTATPDMISPFHASMAAPIAYRKAVEVNDGRYVDGAFDPMPVEKVIEQFQPTDILILPNTPFDRMDAFETTPGEYLVSELIEGASKVIPAASLGTVEKFLRIKEQIRKSLEFIQKQKGVNIGILWPRDSGLTNVTTDAVRIKAAVLESARGVIKEFGAQQPREIELFESKN
ncbi:MAG: patatin-like phospholipase family protein [Candidatus Sungiibacteriota bacterium]|uniref:Patatin-like phospholipase family protein n=1 Tax=Candidatus Sungiibacteriota bacterium TaxID=2750080 RepID=A0A7T5RKC6_9BACT|nr:MAG: patatin-like phospholipase family protein [Candidatus Sungbacteria bacterium]